MSHTYAHAGEFADYLRDNGSTETINPGWLVHLEGASRRVDGYCARSQFGSGFGPRIGTNTYDAPYDWNCLYLEDDLLALTSVGKVDTFNGGTVALVQNTDYVARTRSGAYGPAPYGELFIHKDSTAVFGIAQTVVTGTWGYGSATLPLGTATLALPSTSATSVVLTGGTAFAGMTLLTGSEHVYVVTGGTSTITVRRGQNGTTAAAGTAAVSYFTYPSEVTEATLQVAMRRWKGRDAGVSGDYGGGQIPVTMQRDSEWSILNGTISHLRIFSAG